MRSSVLPKGPLERHPSLFCLLIGTQPFLLMQVMETQRRKKKGLSMQLPLESIPGISTTTEVIQQLILCANEQRIVSKNHSNFRLRCRALARVGTRHNDL